MNISDLSPQYDHASRQAAQLAMELSRAKGASEHTSLAGIALSPDQIVLIRAMNATLGALYALHCDGSESAQGEILEAIALLQEAIS